MKFQIVISEQAESDIKHLYQRAYDHAPMTAPRWYAKLGKAIQSLEELPERCPWSPEGESYALPLRQLIFGKRHGAIRILFAIKDTQVTVIHCVRASRENLSRDDIDL
jgi:plasmid stabilization system protein ParE